MSEKQFEAASRDDLTPSAQQVLDGLLEDLAVRTVVEARALSVGRTVDAHEIIEAFQRQTHAGRSSPDSSRIRRLLLLYVAVAVLTATTALILIITDALSTPEEVPQILLLMASSTAVASMALLYTVRARARRIQSNSTPRMMDAAASVEFLEGWRHLEALLRLMAAERLGSSSYRKPLTSVLNELRGTGDLDNAEYELIKNQLKVRNALAHGNTVDRAIRLREIEKVDSLVMRLSGRIR